MGGILIENVPSFDPDLIFVCGYKKVLKTDLIDKYKFINIHAGILPKWRGYNSNCWAMINGENKVGYSLHRVRPKFDAGEIYKIIDVELEENETYQSARKRLQNKLCDQLENIFFDIVTNNLKAVAQNDNDVVYNCKLRQSDGDIDWNNSTSYIMGLFRVFNGGTGIRLFDKNFRPYEIINMTPANEIANSIGVPGSIVNNYDNGAVLIKTKDTAVKVYELIDESGKRIKPAEIFKIGMRLKSKRKD
ncbi:MAG: hypothetical protein IJ728_11295 [Selenomonadaceae bacterium]|nr:hypothetical protein [Selenomonadaceae bacterium]